MSTVTLERPPASADEAPAKDGGLTAAMAALAERFEFRDEADVREFVAANPDLVDHILSIPARTAPYFPADRRLILEVLHDPEEETAEPGLFALIPVCLPAEEARRRLVDMGRELWEGPFRGVGLRLNIDVEFV
jgi:hypothetical protein